MREDELYSTKEERKDSISNSSNYYKTIANEFSLTPISCGKMSYKIRKLSFRSSLSQTINPLRFLAKS